MEEYKHLLPTNCPPPRMVCIILDFILKHNTSKFMDTHIHQILGTSTGTGIAHSHHTQKLAHCCQQHHTLYHLAIQPTPNPTLFTLHKHMVPHGKTPRTTTHTHPHTPIRTYPHITTVVTPVFSSIPDTPNSSSCHGQWIKC